MERKISHSQNFIKSSSVVNHLLNLPDVEISPTDTLLDIGSGRGIIADSLYKRIGGKGKLELIEIDKRYYNQLLAKYRNDRKVQVHQIDFLDYELPAQPFKIFSNIPFNYTTDILKKILDPENSMVCAYLVIQLEALESWGGSQIDEDGGETLKSLILYPFYEISQLYAFKRGDFEPKPSVNPVFGKFMRRDKSLINPDSANQYYDFIAAISEVRVGEGVWKLLFTPKQMNYFYKNSLLVKNRGLSSQNASKVLEVFNSFVDLVSDEKKKVIEGSMDNLERRTSEIEKLHRTR